MAAGIWLGWLAARSLVAMLAGVGEPPPLDVTPRIAIFAFAAGVTAMSALAAGLWPALRASRAAPALDLKRSEALSSSKRLGSWIVPVQVAISVSLLVAASLLGGTFLHLLVQNSGFRPDGLVMADVDLSAAKPTPKQAAQDAWRMVEALENTPGVSSATLLSNVPIHNGWAAAHYFSLGKNGRVHTDMQTWPESASPGYFATMGTAILQGRAFAQSDLNDGRVCVLSAAAAAFFFPKEDAVGRFVYSSGSDPAKDGTDVDPKSACRVIGVAEDARFLSLREAPPRMVYSLAESDDWGTHFSLAVRGASAAVAADALRNAARQVAPLAPAPAVYTFSELVNAHLQQERMLTALSMCFAGIAVLLTGLGLYGLLARSVLLRTREIGLRMALGARPRDALVRVALQGSRLVLTGAVAGVAAALVLSRMLRSLLFGVEATNPITLAGVMGVLLVVVVAAACIPALRATRVDPMEALRCE